MRRPAAWRGATSPRTLADEVELGGGLAYDGGWLFATLSSGTVIGLNASSGTEVWHQSLLLPLRAAPTVADGRLLVVSADNQLYALDGETGQPMWRHTGFFEGAGLLGGPSPAVGDSVVVVPYSSAEVYALRLDNGRPLWNDTVQRPRRTQGLAEINDIDGMPVIEDSRVYVASYGGQMAAIDLLRGIRVWDIDLASTQTPWLAGDFIYLLTTRGEVVCLLRENGRVRWVSPLPRLEDPDDPSSEPISWTGPILVGDRLLLAGSTGEALSHVALQRRDPGPHRSARAGADSAGGCRWHRLFPDRGRGAAGVSLTRPRMTPPCPSRSPSSAGRTSASRPCSTGWWDATRRWSTPRRA